MNETEEDLEWQRPRSHSLPNLHYIDPDDIFDADSDKDETKEKSNYVFK